MVSQMPFRLGYRRWDAFRPNSELMEALASDGQPDAVSARIQALKCFSTEFNVGGGVGKRWSVGCRFGSDTGVRMLFERLQC